MVPCWTSTYLRERTNDIHSHSIQRLQLGATKAFT